MTSLTLEKELNLRKDIVLNIKKSLNLEGVVSQIVFALDKSGSMSHLYESKEVQKLTERILPLGMAFDQNQEIDFYIFESGFNKINPNVTPSNISNYVDNYVMKYGYGGTKYAPVIDQIIKDFNPPTSSGGFLGIGSKKRYNPLSVPVYVVMITDGENSDPSEAVTAIQEAAKAGIFFQFIGIGNDRFNFLQKLDTMPGRVIDNANFFQIDNINSKSDQELYQLMLAEYPSFLLKARSQGLIR
jgi:hypothetical protein